MDPKQKEAVERKAAEDAATAEAVKKEEAERAAAAAENQPDLTVELEAALKTIEQISTERDNYKRVALGKKRGDEGAGEMVTEEEVERRADERAKEIVKQRELEAAEKTARETALKIAKENRELRTALRNKNGITNGPSGAGQGDDNKPNPTGHFFSEAQIAALKAMERNMPPGVKLDPKKIEEMHRRRTGR